MQETSQENKPLENLLKEAQLEKMNLEIENLKKDNRWPKKLAAFVPLIAVGGFLFGILQFINDQQKERLARDVEQRLKIESQIRSDIEHILHFPGDKQQTISNISFLLEDLRSHLELRDDISQTATSQDRKKSLAYSFTSSITDDCNFDQHRDVNYAVTLIALWDELGQSLSEENTGSLEFILSKFTEAQKNIYDKDPEIIRSVRFVKEQNSFSYPRGYGKLNATQLFHFHSIVNGFKEYLTYLKDEKTRDRHLIRFQGAMCNGALMEEYFGVKFNREIAPEEFIKCPK